MPIDQTLRGLALRIDTSVDPETQPLLEYSFIEDNTQTILARIRGIPQPDGGGQLAFETNAGARNHHSADGYRPSRPRRHRNRESYSQIGRRG